MIGGHICKVMSWQGNYNELDEYLLQSCFGSADGVIEERLKRFLCFFENVVNTMKGFAKSLICHIHTCILKLVSVVCLLKCFLSLVTLYRSSSLLCLQSFNEVYAASFRVDCVHTGTIL